MLCIAFRVFFWWSSQTWLFQTWLFAIFRSFALFCSVKSSCLQFWGRKWLRQFYGRLEKMRSFCRKTHVHKFPRFRGGLLGGGSADFIFMGARIFRSFAPFCTLWRSFVDSRLHSFVLICALLRAFACVCVRPRLERPRLGTADFFGFFKPLPKDPAISKILRS